MSSFPASLCPTLPLPWYPGEDSAVLSGHWHVLWLVQTTDWETRSFIQVSFNHVNKQLCCLLFSVTCELWRFYDCWYNGFLVLWQHPWQFCLWKLLSVSCLSHISNYLNLSCVQVEQVNLCFQQGKPKGHAKGTVTKKRGNWSDVSDVWGKKVKQS